MEEKITEGTVVVQNKNAKKASLVVHEGLPCEK